MKEWVRKRKRRKALETRCIEKLHWGKHGDSDEEVTHRFEFLFVEDNFSKVKSSKEAIICRSYKIFL